MNLTQMLATMRSLSNEVLEAKDVESVAEKASAVVQLFSIFDVMAGAGHDLPASWTFARATGEAV